jgi:hypothetical protein
MRFTKNTTLCAMLCVCSLLGGAGCIGPQDDSEVVDDLMSKTPAISPELWSPSTSEEDSPAVCGTNPVTLVGGVECDGSYCDNIGLNLDFACHEREARIGRPKISLGTDPRANGRGSTLEVRAR